MTSFQIIFVFFLTFHNDTTAIFFTVVDFFIVISSEIYEHKE